MTRTPCAATSKRTGKPCGRAATPGSRVCHYHGSGSPQARRKALERRTLADLMGQGLALPPEQLIADAQQTAAALYEWRKRAVIEAGDPPSLEAIERVREALVPAVQLSKLAIDAGIRFESLDQQRARAMAGLFDRAMVRAGLSPAQQQSVRVGFEVEVRALPGKGQPNRLQRSDEDLMVQARAAAPAPPVRPSEPSTPRPAPKPPSEPDGVATAATAGGPAIVDAEPAGDAAIEGELLPARSPSDRLADRQLAAAAQRYAIEAQPARCAVCHEPGHVGRDCPLAGRMGGVWQWR